MLYLPKFTHDLHIWYDLTMTTALDTMLDPLIKILSSHKRRSLTAHNHRIIANELDILLSEQQYIKSLLSYTSRLPTKAPHNPARQLLELLERENHPSSAHIDDLLNSLSDATPHGPALLATPS
jgi:hypothetical protein